MINWLLGLMAIIVCVWLLPILVQLLVILIPAVVIALALFMGLMILGYLNSKKKAH